MFALFTGKGKEKGSGGGGGDREAAAAVGQRRIRPARRPQEVERRAAACMVLAGSGDAIGYHGGRWEFNPSGEQIRQEYEELGGHNGLHVKGRHWTVSDDTIQHIGTAESLLAGMHPEAQEALIAAFADDGGASAGGGSGEGGGGGGWSRNPYEEELFSNWVTHCAEAYVRSFNDMAGRAPGGTCRTGADWCNPLKKNRHWRDYPYLQGRLTAGCGAAMRSACVGVALYGTHRRRLLVACAMETGRLSHNHPAGLLGALVPALFTAYAMEGQPATTWGAGFLTEALPIAREYMLACARDLDHLSRSDMFPDSSQAIAAFDDFEHMMREYCDFRGLPTELNDEELQQQQQQQQQDQVGEQEELEYVCLFPAEHLSSHAARDAAYRTCFCLPTAERMSDVGGGIRWEGWDGYSAVLVAYDAFLASGGRWGELVHHAALHGGDNDSTGTICGAWYGAAFGWDGVPEGHYSSLEYNQRLVALSRGLAFLGQSVRPVASTAGRTQQQQQQLPEDLAREQQLQERVLAADVHVNQTVEDAYRQLNVSEDPAERDDVVICAVADLHGHADLLDQAMQEARGLVGEETKLIVVTVGDYVDNGPQVPQLLNRLIELHTNPPPRTAVLSIAGNHDLACCLSALPGVFGAPASHPWFSQWQGHYMNVWQGPRAVTPMQYTKTSELPDATMFRAAVSPGHVHFLLQLPWFLELGQYLFVHAGLQHGAVEPQLEFLRQKSVASCPPGGLPPQIRSKQLSRAHDPEGWGGRIVISGHTKFNPPENFVQTHRLTFESGTCKGDQLNCAILPARRTECTDPLEVSRFFSVGP